MILSRARNILNRVARTSNDIVNSIPDKDDNLAQKIIKAISLVNTIDELVNGKKDPVVEYAHQLNLQVKTNEPFVSLFFSNDVKSNFDISKISLDNNLNILKVKVPNNGELYFAEHKYDRTTEVDEEFYYTDNFDFKALMDSIWELYNNKIYVTLTSREYRWKPSFSQFSVTEDKIFGSAKNLLEKISKKNERALANGVPRSYMLFGPPGSGKSTFAQKLGGKNKKIIKFDSKSLDSLTTEGVGFLLSGLVPDYLIIDDVDKVIYGSSIATLLYILEKIKIEFPKTVVIVTANNTDHLDKALLRAGRLDEPIPFDLQSAEDRTEIFNQYVKEYAVDIKPSDIQKIIDQTSGLSAAYLKEIAIQLKLSSMDDVLSTIEIMKRLLKLTEEVPEPIEPKSKKSKKSKKRKKKKNGN